MTVGGGLVNATVALARLAESSFRMRVGQWEGEQGSTERRGGSGRRLVYARQLADWESCLKYPLANEMR